MPTATVRCQRRLITGCKVIHRVVPNAHCHFTSIHTLITRCNMIPSGMLNMHSHFTSINKLITRCKAVQRALPNMHSHFRQPWRHCMWGCTMTLLTVLFSLGQGATAQWGTSTSDSLTPTLVVRFQMEISLAHVHADTIWQNTFKYPGKYPNL